MIEEMNWLSILSYTRGHNLKVKFDVGNGGNACIGCVATLARQSRLDNTHRTALRCPARLRIDFPGSPNGFRPGRLCCIDTGDSDFPVIGFSCPRAENLKKIQRKKSVHST